MRRPAASALALALLPTLVAACGAPPAGAVTPAGGSAVHSTGPVGSLDEARARWAAAGITDYDLTVGRSCFCTAHGLVRATVRGGRPTAVTVERADYPNHSALPPTDTPTTVEALFDRVRDEQASAEKVTVTYDPATGVPVRIFADRMVHAYDDEVTFEVSITPIGR